MNAESAGGGPLRRSIALLWNLPGPVRRGPKPSRSVDEVIQAAIALADAEGLAALSIRRVADTLGLSPMALYTYVPSKAELLDLMLERIAAEPMEPPGPNDGWRTRLEQYAHRNWNRGQRHPWIVQVSVHRPPLGPNVVARMEEALQAVDGLGLTELEMDLIIGVLNDYVWGSVRSAIESKEIEQQSGISDEQWWRLNSELLKEVLQPARYPTAVRVSAAYEAMASMPDVGDIFEFGLQRVLDGLAAFIAARQAGAS